MLYDAVKLFALSIASWGGGQTITLPSINCRTKNAGDATRSSALRDIMKKVIPFTQPLNVLIVNPFPVISERGLRYTV